MVSPQWLRRGVNHKIAAVAAGSRYVFRQLCRHIDGFLSKVAKMSQFQAESGTSTRSQSPPFLRRPQRKQSYAYPRRVVIRSPSLGIAPTRLIAEGPKTALPLSDIGLQSWVSNYKWPVLTAAPVRPRFHGFVHGAWGSDDCIMRAFRTAEKKWNGFLPKF